MSQAKTNDEPLVAVIIPSYQNAEDIRRCLKSVGQLTYGNILTIVVDNNSSEEVLLAIQEAAPTAVCIPLHQNLGFAGGCQRGYEEAVRRGADFVFLLNQDAVVEPATLTSLVERLEALDGETIGAVQPLILRDEQPLRVNSLGNAIHFLGYGFATWDGARLDDPRVALAIARRGDLAYASGAAVLVRVSVLGDEPLFDPTFFMYHEDLDLGWRLALMGKRSVLVPEARVLHRYEFSRSTKIKYEFGERNRLIVLLKNYRLGTLLLIFPMWLTLEVATLALSFMKGWAREKIRGYVYVFRDMKTILLARREVQRSRVVSDREIVKLFEGRILYQDGPPTVLLNLANPVLEAYWAVVRRLIVW